MTTTVQNNLQSFTNIYPWISTPLIVSAPMRVTAGPALATAVSRAGGIGFIGAGGKPSDLAPTLAEARKMLESFEPPLKTRSPENTHGASQTISNLLPIGIGFLTFDADIDVAADAIHEHPPAAIWLFAPRDGQEEFDLWSARIREVSPGTQIWIQVGSVRDAVEAARSKQAPDVLVIQGSDAGGHGLAKGAGVISLLPEADDALRAMSGVLVSGVLAKPIPLIAAGGIVDGRGVASALTLGAVGAALGTRFLASSEAKISSGYQRDVLRITDGGQNTVRTTLYDDLAGRVSWPPEYDGRNVVNASMRERDAGVEFEVLRERYVEAGKRGDDGWGEEGRLMAYVGAGVGLVKEVSPAGDIVSRVREHAKSVLLQTVACLNE